MWVIGWAMVSVGGIRSHFCELKYVLYLDFCSYFIKTKKNQEIVNSEISSKTPLLQTSKKLTKSPLLQTSKNREIAEKKIVRNFLHKIKILFFFEFFSENVLKTLLRGRETTRKKYRIVFEKFEKYVIFFDFGCPSITHHPSSVNTSWLWPGTPEGWSNRTTWGCLPKNLYFMIIIEIQIRLWHF